MLQSYNKACKSQTSVGLKDNKKNVHHQALKTIKNWISQFPKKKRREVSEEHSNHQPTQKLVIIKIHTDLENNREGNRPTTKYYHGV
jgi:hypothetical protein